MLSIQREQNYHEYSYRYKENYQNQSTRVHHKSPDGFGLLWFACALQPIPMAAGQGTGEQMKGKKRKVGMGYGVVRV